LLEVLCVNKEFHDLGKEIFYAENTFIVHDCEMGAEYDSDTDQTASPLWLQLMHREKFEDGTPYYGTRPDRLFRNLEFDMKFDDTYPPTNKDFSSALAHVLLMPKLQKLTLDCEMSTIKTVNAQTDPSALPGLRMLIHSLAATCTDAIQRLKISIPNNALAEEWLNAQIALHADDPAKLPRDMYAWFHVPNKTQIWPENVPYLVGKPHAAHVAITEQYVRVCDELDALEPGDMPSQQLRDDMTGLAIDEPLDRFGGLIILSFVELWKSLDRFKVTLDDDGILVTPHPDEMVLDLETDNRDVNEGCWCVEEHCNIANQHDLGLC